MNFFITCTSHDYGFLYDLEKDPEETKNLFENPEYQSQRTQLEKEMKGKLIAIGGPLYLPGEYQFSKKAKNKQEKSK